MVSMRKFCLLLAASALLASGSAACTTGDAELEPVTNLALDCAAPRDTTEGPVSGRPTRTRQSCAYMGIPFAAAPVGDLRFAPPQPPPVRKMLLRAKEAGKVCLQKTDVSSVTALPIIPTYGDEDCLFLNIWRPMGEKLPVMVFIHGGAFTLGAGSWGTYDGDLLTEEGVIVVTVNYRLGPFGFLAHPALRDEDALGSTGNQGILDQIEALRWVKANIASFGGDPDNITIFGESAGAMSVCTLMATPLAAGLFQRAIMESGGCKAVATTETGYAFAAGYAQDVGCAGAPDAAQLACMRAKPADELIEEMQFDVLASALQPHVDGVVLTDLPLNMLDKGSNAAVMLGGSNANEVQAVSLTNPHSFTLRTTSWKDYGIALRSAFGVTMATEIARFYGAAHHPNPFDSWFTLKSDYALTCPTLLGVLKAAKSGPAYHYLFDWSELGAVGEAMGSAHAFELFFIFGALDTFHLLIPDESLPAALALAERMRGLWGSFARTGVPAAQGMPVWPEVAGGSMLLAEKPEIIADLKREACAFWAPHLPVGIENLTADVNEILNHLP
jgi:para-nitrobenzyl esterase